MRLRVVPSEPEAGTPSLAAEVTRAGIRKREGTPLGRASGDLSAGSPFQLARWHGEAGTPFRFSEARRRVWDPAGKNIFARGECFRDEGSHPARHVPGSGGGPVVGPPLAVSLGIRF